MMEDTFRENLLPVILGNSAQIERFRVITNTEKAAEIAIGSMIYV
jgi:hypothetical protein